MSEQLTVSYMSAGEVRITAELRPEERRWGAYVRGLSAEGARALAAELLQAADEADADPSGGSVRPDEEPATDVRCPALNPFGYQCTLATGHDGLHQSPDEEPTP